MEIQSEMATRCIELLEIPDDESRLILDIGCGSGLSGECLDENGHTWVGLDISQSMLSTQLVNLNDTKNRLTRIVNHSS